MTLALHKWHTTEQALAAFSEQLECDWYCEGQFAVTPNAVLCFITVGEAPHKSHLESSDRLIWKPLALEGNNDGDSADQADWLPEAVRENHDRSGPKPRKIREHHLFLKLASDTRYLYAGEASLFTWCMAGRESLEDANATFSIRTLPKDVWLYFGGYPGWQITLGEIEHRLDFGDTASFDALLNKVKEGAESHLYMTRYEKDFLLLTTNISHGYIVYDGHIVGVNPNYDGKPTGQVIFTCMCGIPEERPAELVFPIAEACNLARLFFINGQLPTQVTWESWGAVLARQQPTD